MKDSLKTIKRKELKDDPKVDRDHKARGGRLQLFIPAAIVARERMRDRYIDNMQEEGSTPMKKPKPKDIQVLRDHVDRQDVDHANAWLRAAADSPSEKRPNIAGTASGEPNTKKVAVEREVPKFAKIMEKELLSLNQEFDKAWSQAEKARDALAASEKPLNDRSSHLYKSTLQFRMQVASRFLGNQDVVIVLGKPTVAAAASGGDGQQQPQEEGNGGRAGGDDSQVRTEQAAEHIQEDTGSEASLQLVFAHAPRKVCDEYSASIRAMSVSVILEKKKAQLPFGGAIADFLTRSDMQKFYTDLFLIDTGDAEAAQVFLARKARWQRVKSNVSEFSKELSKSAHDVLSHIKSLQVKEKLNQEQVVRELQKAELDKTKKRSTIVF